MISFKIFGYEFHADCSDKKVEHEMFNYALKDYEDRHKLESLKPRLDDMIFYQRERLSLENKKIYLAGLLRSKARKAFKQNFVV